MDRYAELKALLERVRRRWVAAAALAAYTRAAAVSTVVLAVALVALLLVRPTGLALLATAAVALLLVVSAFAWMAWTVRRAPSDVRVARFIEERCPDLDDRVATAVQFGERPDLAPSRTLLGLMIGDAAARVRAIDFDRIVSRARLRRAAGIAAAASAAFGAALYFSGAPVRQAYGVLAMYAFPSRIALEVAPGDTRVRAGQSLQITVRLQGASAVVTPTLTIEGAAAPRELAPTGTPNEFRTVIDAVSSPFKYTVSAGAVTTRAYAVSVLRAPRVARIDLQYAYPAAFGLTDRAEEDGGDIYAPVGTTVRIRVKADKPVRSAQMVMADGTRVTLSAIGADLAGGEIRISEDGSYRVALADADGLDNPGDTEYFIRTLDDRPPDVRILRPAGDRQVTRLEEVAIEARAEDDYGVSRFELVYQVRGGAEKAIPFRNAQSGLSVTGSHTLYLEDLDVQAGDFVSYYARARDVSRGKRSTEARSDIFFLEVKPYGEEFTAAQSNAPQAGGGQPMDELAAAQKEIIIATWKLDRRSQGGKSEQDIHAVARAQHELRKRAEQAAGESRMFGSRRRGVRPGQLETPGPTPDDPMARAVQAMTKAGAQLDALSTSGALPHEMEALNELLKAQAENRKRQIARQQGGGGMGSNRQTQDLSTLFDRELQRQQQTNYETPTSSESREKPSESALDKIRELARRQDELGRQQQDLAQQRAQMSADELRRQLERLTREQSELRRQAEELSRQLAQQGQKSGSSQSGQGQSGQGQAGQSAQQKKSMRDISEEMRNAANDLRREDPAQASASSEKALKGLRDLERQIQTSHPDDRRRRLGDMGLEAQQIADAQRQIASEMSRLGKNGSPSGDALRRLAGEKERLADRVDKLQNNVKQMAGADRANGTDPKAVGDVVKEMDRQQLQQRMRESASTLRGAAQSADAKSGQKGGDDKAQGGALDPGRQSSLEQDLARALDRVAEKMGAASGAQDGESRRLSEQLGRTRDLRDRMTDLERQIEAKRAAGGSPSGKDGQKSPQPSQGGGGQPSPSQQNAQSDSSAAGGSSGSPDAARLQEEYGRLYRQARELMDQNRRSTPQSGVGGSTPELPNDFRESTGGREGVQQDFAKWDSLRKDITLALEQLETALSRQLKDKDMRDRLNAGADASTPEAYRRLVEKYFQSIASRKKP